ncbi:MAG: hypothetical protein AB4050_12920 [Synechococcus sp.]
MGCDGDREGDVLRVASSSRLADELNAPLRGKMLLDPRICQQGDTERSLLFPDTTAEISPMFSQFVRGPISRFNVANSIDPQSTTEDGIALLVVW